MSGITINLSGIQVYSKNMAISRTTQKKLNCEQANYQNQDQKTVPDFATSDENMLKLRDLPILQNIKNLATIRNPKSKHRWDENNSNHPKLRGMTILEIEQNRQSLILQ